MIFADKLAALRRQQGWSQEDLAEKINVSRQSVSKWESNQSMPDLQKILQLSEIFGVSTDYLLKDDMKPSGQEGEAVTISVPAVRKVSARDADEFLSMRESASRRIALGAFLCIMSPTGLFALPALRSLPGKVIYDYTASGAGLAGLVILFLLVAAAVAIFITTGAGNACFAFLEKEPFELEPGLADVLRERQNGLRPKHTLFNAIGACLCILSPVPLLVGAFSYSEPLVLLMLCVTMVIAGIGVVFFITAGIKWAAYEKLLREGEYSSRNMETGKLKSKISSIYWLAVTAGYLAWSFAANAWDRSWIVWPVAGVVFAAVMVVCDIVGKNKE
ncbi:MAG: helix-turn-helix transcriptional regulator [Clostridiales bacterium]|nr:helix-turn-helix transcriptional regulator [Clostridiales bacterium]